MIRIQVLGKRLIKIKEWLEFRRGEFSNSSYYSWGDVKDDAVMRLHHHKVLASLLTKLILTGNNYARFRNEEKRKRAWGLQHPLQWYQLLYNNMRARMTHSKEIFFKLVNMSCIVTTQLLKPHLAICM